VFGKGNRTGEKIPKKGKKRRRGEEKKLRTCRVKGGRNNHGKGKRPLRNKKKGGRREIRTGGPAQATSKVKASKKRVPGTGGGKGCGAAGGGGSGHKKQPKYRGGGGGGSNEGYHMKKKEKRRKGGFGIKESFFFTWWWGQIKERTRSKSLCWEGEKTVLSAGNTGPYDTANPSKHGRKGEYLLRTVQKKKGGKGPIMLNPCF